MELIFYKQLAEPLPLINGCPEILHSLARNYFALTETLISIFKLNQKLCYHYQVNRLKF